MEQQHTTQRRPYRPEEQPYWVPRQPGSSDARSAVHGMGRDGLPSEHRYTAPAGEGTGVVRDDGSAVPTGRSLDHPEPGTFGRSVLPGGSDTAGVHAAPKLEAVGTGNWARGRWTAARQKIPVGRRPGRRRGRDRPRGLCLPPPGGTWWSPRRGRESGTPWETLRRGRHGSLRSGRPDGARGGCGPASAAVTVPARGHTLRTSLAGESTPIPAPGGRISDHKPNLSDKKQLSVGKPNGSSAVSRPERTRGEYT
jgi:hypothetical protein